MKNRLSRHSRPAKNAVARPAMTHPVAVAPADFVAQAQRCEAAKDWPGAAAIYRRLLAAQPEHAGAWAALGACELRLDRSAGIICDQTIALDGFYTKQDYPTRLRRVRFKDPETGKTLVFLTNQMTLPSATICALYKNRWQVELFFKWIKQHLRIKRFFGTSENAVKTQIWIAVSVYVLVAIVKKRLRLDASLYTLLQTLSVTLFEKMPLQQAFSGSDSSSDSITINNQLNLFAF